MKHRYGIKGKLLVSFLLFSVIVIALLWVLQVVFFDDIYRSTKTHSLRKAAEKIHEMSDDSLQDWIEREAADFDLCTVVYNSEMKPVASEHAGGQCVVHNIPSDTVSLFYKTTKNCEGMSFESHLPAEQIEQILRRSEMSKDFFKNFFNDGRYEAFPLNITEEAHDLILICRVFENRDGAERFVLLSTVITPVDSALLTIRFELLLVSFSLALVSVLMAYILSKNISRPLVNLNQASKKLSEGKFDGTGIQGYLEVEELSATLSEAAEEVSKVDRLRRELVANVSHDLRTPLTLISGYSEAMRDLPGENTAENLQIVIDETHRLSELVSDLMDLSKMEAGMDQLKTEKIELTALIRSICNRYEKMTGFQGYNMQLSLSEESVFVQADSVKLKQVIYNLVNNAVNYCGSDRYVGVSLTKNSGYAVVEIVDHGEGIPADKLSEIWDRYYRVDRNHKSAAVGTGLGLSIVKKILDLHGAKFGVESRVGYGSRFWFALPLEEKDGE